MHQWPQAINMKLGFSEPPITGGNPTGHIFVQKLLSAQKRPQIQSPNKFTCHSVAYYYPALTGGWHISRNIDICPVKSMIAFEIFDNLMVLGTTFIQIMIYIFQPNQGWGISMPTTSRSGVAHDGVWAALYHFWKFEGRQPFNLHFSCFQVCRSWGLSVNLIIKGNSLFGLLRSHPNWNTQRENARSSSVPSHQPRHESRYSGATVCRPIRISDGPFR